MAWPFVFSCSRCSEHGGPCYVLGSRYYNTYIQGLTKMGGGGCLLGVLKYKGILRCFFFFWGGGGGRYIRRPFLS